MCLNKSLLCIRSTSKLCLISRQSALVHSSSISTNISWNNLCCNGRERISDQLSTPIKSKWTYSTCDIVKLGNISSVLNQSLYTSYTTHSVSPICLMSLRSNRYLHTQTKLYCDGVSVNNDDGDDVMPLNDDDEDTVAEVDELKGQLNESVRKHCQLLDAGHQVFIVQVYDRHVTGEEIPRNASTVKNDLAENIGLIEAIPKWTVVDSMIVRVKSVRSIRRLTNAFERVREKLITLPQVTAVFVSLNKVAFPVLVLAQQKWKLPVYDRSFIITQVFKSYAVTREAKVHVSLAELPYLRFCLMRRSSIQFNEDMPRLGTTLPFKDHERKLKASLVSLKKQRNLVRTSRSTRQIPTVAVIGYTNSGKTTLIKALTGDEKLTPRNRLFATLDVTAHSGILPNNMTVLYMDTVGFISHLPFNMKSAFIATLEDTISADVIVHVRDISHPDTEAQKIQVIESVRKILSDDKMNSMVEVCNKVDLISPDMNTMLDKNVFAVSSVTGNGMEALMLEIQRRLLTNIDFIKKRLKIPMNGPHLSWLHKEATVVSTDMADDPECIIVHVYITENNYRKFLGKFGRKKSTNSSVR
ncbi:putative GTP-binding protein 6 [Mactra antiquata]